jgi:hypothetical protein
MFYLSDKVLDTMEVVLNRLICAFAVSAFVYRAQASISSFGVNPAPI